jgi:hypothetical protein
MRFLIMSAVIVLLSGGGACAQSSYGTRGYVKKDGTYVEPHRSTKPNSTVNDNWSTKPNVNPYTGKAGTREPSYTSPTYKPPKPPKSVF